MKGPSIKHWSLVLSHWSFPPVSTAGVVEWSFPAADGVIDLTVAEHFLAQHPGANGPTGQGDAVPRRPAAFGLLLGIANCHCLVEVNEHEVRIISDFDPPLADDVPDPRG